MRQEADKFVSRKALAAGAQCIGRWESTCGSAAHV